MQNKKNILLDRDGVINKKPPKAHYITDWSQFEFLPGAIEGLKLLSKIGYNIFLISNQAGIARGIMTIDDLKKIHNKLLERCKKERITITDIYFCPHGWDEACACRKPKPGLLFKAANDYKFDIRKAIFIGDDKRDKEAGDAAGCRTIKMSANGNLLSVLKQNAI